MSGKTKHLISILILVAVTAVIMFLLKEKINFHVASDNMIGAEITDAYSESTLLTSNSTDTGTNTPSVSSVVASAGTEKGEDNEYNEENEDVVLKETEDAGSDYLSKIIFIGDKTIYQLGRYAYTGIPDPVHQVWSTEENIPVTKVSSINSFLYPGTLEAMTFVDAVKRKAPQYIILTFGSYEPNGEVTRETLFSSLGTFAVSLKAASPNSQIMIQSVFPTGYSCEIIDAEHIRTINSWLRELCAEYELYYLNTWSVLADDSGYLKSDYYDTDGYLLNEVGYKEVVNYISCHAHPSYSN